MVTCTKRDVAKYILYVCLVLLLLFARVGIVSGFLILVGYTSFQNDLKEVIAGGSLLIISAIFLVPAIVLGTLGVRKNSSTLLRIFVAPMIVAFIMSVISIVLLRQSHKPEHAKQRLEAALNNYNSSKADRGFWKDLQKRYQCCGIDGFGDWKSNGIFLPKSCCQKRPSTEVQDENKSCKSFGNDLSYVHTKGCRQKLNDAQERFNLNALIVEIAFIVSQLAAKGAAHWLVYDMLQRFTWF